MIINFLFFYSNKKSFVLVGQNGRNFESANFGIFWPPDRPETSFTKNFRLSFQVTSAPSPLLFFDIKRTFEKKTFF
jgi:hypothetical protein